MLSGKLISFRKFTFNMKLRLWILIVTFWFGIECIIFYLKLWVYWWHFNNLHLSCRLPGYAETPHNRNFSENCDGSTRIPDQEYMQKMPSSQLVRDAVYSVATALNDIHKEKCDGKPGLCDKMKKLEGKLLKKYLLKAKFYGTIHAFLIFITTYFLDCQDIWKLYFCRELENKRNLVLRV